MKTKYIYSYHLYLGTIDYLTEQLNIFIFDVDYYFKYLIDIIKNQQTH